MKQAIHKMMPTLTYSKNIDGIGLLSGLLQLGVSIYAFLFCQGSKNWGQFGAVLMAGSVVSVCAVLINKLQFQEVLKGKLTVWEHGSMPLLAAVAAGAEIYTWSSLCGVILTYKVIHDLYLAVGAGVLLLLLSLFKGYHLGVMPVRRVAAKLDIARELRPVEKISQKLILKLACAHPEVSSYLSKLAELRRLPTKGELWMLTKHHLSARKQLTNSSKSASTQTNVPRLTSEPEN